MSGDYLPPKAERFWDTPGRPRRRQPWVSVDCGRCGARLGRVYPSNGQRRSGWPSTEMGWRDMLGAMAAYTDALWIANPEPFRFTVHAVCSRCGSDARCRMSRFAPVWLAAFSAGPPSRVRIHPDGTPE